MIRWSDNHGVSSHTKSQNVENAPFTKELLWETQTWEITRNKKKKENWTGIHKGNMGLGESSPPHALTHPKYRISGISVWIWI